METVPTNSVPSHPSPDADMCTMDYVSHLLGKQGWESVEDLGDDIDEYFRTPSSSGTSPEPVEVDRRVFSSVKLQLGGSSPAAQAGPRRSSHDARPSAKGALI